MRGGCLSFWVVLEKGGRKGRREGEKCSCDGQCNTFTNEKLFHLSVFLVERERERGREGGREGGRVCVCVYLPYFIYVRACGPK